MLLEKDMTLIGIILVLWAWRFYLLLDLLLVYLIEKRFKWLTMKAIKNDLVFYKIYDYTEVDRDIINKIPMRTKQYESIYFSFVDSNPIAIIVFYIEGCLYESFA